MSIPVHCRPLAFDEFVAVLPQLETTAGLVRAATAISMHELHNASPDMVLIRLQALADEVRSRTKSTHDQALLAHLHELLFEEADFRGNSEDYYNPRNSYLPTVLESRRGLPITLSLVYKAVAEPLGLRASGVNAPGHFLARVDTREGPMYVDPFYSGGVLTTDEVFQRIAQATGRHVPRDESLLVAATHRQWISRILNNLQAVFAHAGRMHDLAAMQELQGLLTNP